MCVPPAQLQHDFPIFRGGYVVLGQYLQSKMSVSRSHEELRRSRPKVVGRSDPAARCPIFGVLLIALSSAVLLALQACGGSNGAGGSSGGSNPVPEISSIAPNTAYEGVGPFILTVSGTNFVASSVVQWNGSARVTKFVSSTQLQAATLTSDVALAGTASITVVSPAPGGGTSNPSLFTITNPPPLIGILSPSSILQSGPNFTLTVSGVGFVPSTTVQWNGNPRTTTYVSDDVVQAQITQADIASAGTASVTVYNPPPRGGTSPAVPFPINPNSGPGYSLSIASQESVDLVWDSVNQVIYLSVPSTAATNSNSIAVLNPVTAQIESSQPAGSNPDALAISGDSSYLYAGLDGANMVQRFVLPTLAPDISYSLGSQPTGLGAYFALDLQVAPASPHTTAVSLGIPDSLPEAIGGIVIFDDATPRPTTAPGFLSTSDCYDSLQWGSNASELYAANNEDTGLDFYTLTVGSTGVVLDNDYYGEFTEFGIRIHYDAGTQLVYSDDGLVIDPPTGAQVGNFDASGVMVPDSTVQAAFFLGQTEAQIGTPNFTLESLNLTDFAPTGTITLPNVGGNPIRLIRWGQNGLAFNTDQGQIYSISGTFVA